jgi:ferredoxin
LAVVKIVVDYELCEGNAICVGMAPDVFDLDADDHLRVTDEPIQATRHRELSEIAGSCPRGALRIDQAPSQI